MYGGWICSEEPLGSSLQSQVAGEIEMGTYVSMLYYDQRRWISSQP